jgi:hypothetical protein
MSDRTESPRGAGQHEADDRYMNSYPQIIALRNAEVQAHWTRNNIQITLNSAVLFGFLALLKEPAVKQPPMSLVMVTGGLLAAIWALINRLGHRWVRYWNEQLGDLERKAGLPLVLHRALKGPKLLNVTPQNFRGRFNKRRALLTDHMGALTTATAALFAFAWASLAIKHLFDVVTRYSIIASFVTVGATLVSLWALYDQITSISSGDRVSDEVQTAADRRET